MELDFYHYITAMSKTKEEDVGELSLLQMTHHTSYNGLENYMTDDRQSMTIEDNESINGWCHDEQPSFNMDMSVMRGSPCNSASRQSIQNDDNHCLVDHASLEMLPKFDCFRR